MQIGVIPTAFTQQILENGDAVPISELRKKPKGQTMIDPEVARLRRLRAEALRVREIGRQLGSTRWARNDALFARGAGAAWRIARVVSGKLNAHPYIRYQKGATVAELLRNRLTGGVLSAISKDRASGLKTFEACLGTLTKQLEDSRALTWSTEFSDTLGRSLTELKTLIAEIAVETKSGAAVERQPILAPRADSLVGELAQTMEGDWPYLAF
jgi:hypothetical protein